MRFILLFLTATAGVIGGAMVWMSDDRGNELAVVQDIVTSSLGSRSSATAADADVTSPTQSQTATVPRASSMAGEPAEKRFFGAGLAMGSQGVDSQAVGSPAGAPVAVAPAAPVAAAKPHPWQAEVVASPRAQPPSANSTVLMTTGSLPAPRDIPRHSLVRDIQRELKRVGCYSGDATGEWNMASKRAMQAFLERANSTLPTGDPDLIQLTLVRGYSGAACRPGDASVVAARVPSPRGEQARSETQRGEPTRSAQSPAHNGPVVIRALPQQQQTIAQAAPTQAASSANLATASQSQSRDPSLAQHQPSSASGQPPVVVFEGRMAIGGPRTPEALDTSDSPPITSSAPVVPQLGRMTRPRPPQPSASAQRSRRERTWTGNFFNQ